MSSRNCDVIRFIQSSQYTRLGQPIRFWYLSHIPKASFKVHTLKCMPDAKDLARLHVGSSEFSMKADAISTKISCSPKFHFPIAYMKQDVC